VDELEVQDVVAMCPVAPVPERATVVVELLPLSMRVIIPVVKPSAPGVKVTFIASDAPGETVTPLEIPLAAKPEPPIETLETVMVELVVFVNVTVSVLLPPVLTFPKLRAVTLGFKPEMMPPGVEFEPATPLHPDWLMTASKITGSRIRVRVRHTLCALS